MLDIDAIDLFVASLGDEDLDEEEEVTEKPEKKDKND